MISDYLIIELQEKLKKVEEALQRQQFVIKELLYVIPKKDLE